MRMNGLEGRERLQKNKEGVIIEETMPLNAFEEQAIQAIKEGAEDDLINWDMLLEDARKEANKIIKSVEGFDDMDLEQQIVTLSSILSEMLEEADNSKRYLYGELNRRRQILQENLDYLRRMRGLGASPNFSN